MILRLSAPCCGRWQFSALACWPHAVFFQLASTNMGFSLAQLAPDFNRLNPLAKLKDMPGTNMGHLFQALVMIPVMFWLTGRWCGTAAGTAASAA